MRVNKVEMPGGLVEIQLPEGDTLAMGGSDVGRLFNPFTPIGDGHSTLGWVITPYDIDPWAAQGVLGAVLQREARSADR